MRVRATAPGRVNLIGDHTDYLGGLALPLAIDLATTVTGERGGPNIHLTSTEQPGDVRLPLEDPIGAAPVGSWARYVAGVVAELEPATGFEGAVTTTVPVGSGLSSSAALEVALALALGFEGPPRSLAALCQRAEHRASGVPCGIMDQLTSAAGIEGHALLIDFETLDIDAVAIPPEVEVVVVHSGQARTLVGSAYAERRAQCEAAQASIGALRRASVALVETLTDPIQRRRARHVVTENQRVRDLAAALRARDLVEAGALMTASHASLRDDFEVSTPTLDALVDDLCSVRGVHGARLTGAGFGGCVVALTDPGVLDRGWHVRASGGASVEVLDG